MDHENNISQYSQWFPHDQQKAHKHQDPLNRGIADYSMLVLYSFLLTIKNPYF